MGIKAMVIGFVNKILGRTTLETKLKIKTAVSDEMADAMELWGLMYCNTPPWRCGTVKSLNLPSAIASEIARLVTIEMETHVTGSPRAEWLDGQYLRVIKDLRRYLEYGCALGGLVFKPYVCGKDIAVDFVLANQCYPIAFDSAGRCSDIVFVERKQHGSTYYTRLERHTMENTACIITNSAYAGRSAVDLGNEIPLTEVREWADLASIARIENIDRLLIGYFKPTQANTIDPTSPMGVSVYARAVELIREADKQYSRLLWEFEGGELAVDADAALFRLNPKTGAPELPKGKERLFRALNMDSTQSGTKPLETYAPQLRDVSLINGLNQLLQRIEDTCGLARGTFSDPNQDARTATEIKILKQRSYSTVADTQKSLQAALSDLVYAMNVWATLSGLAPPGEYDMSFEWDDSLIVDMQSEQAIRMQEVAAGLMRPERYIMWRYGCNEEDALALLPDSDRMVD